MPREIERRFLADGEAFLRTHPDVPRLHLHQGYLSLDPSVRIRLNSDLKAKLTIKGAGTIVRSEFEYAVPYEDGVEIMGLSRYYLEKVRHALKVTEHQTWEVDKFLGQLAGLWLAEIELRDPDEQFDKPSWLGREVTEDYRYTNAYLAEYGPWYLD